MFINFIDFKKAFDSVHRESLWKILRAYGVPLKIVHLVQKFYDHFACSIIQDGNLTDFFEVNSGVRQGCILSPMLFLLTIDWVMRQTTADRPRGIQWTPFSKLEDLDFADDLAVLSTSYQHIQQKTDRLSSFAKQTGLDISKQKTKVMRINSTVQTPVTVEGEAIEDVTDFTYLGSVISSDNGAQKDIRARISKARAAFSKLRPKWRSSQLNIKTKLRLYNSNVKSMVLYGSECWRIVKGDMRRVDAFHNSCLKRICKIFWPNKISNASLYERTKSSSLSSEIIHRRLRWLGRVLRMPTERHPRIALHWTPSGRRNRGRPKTTWRRTVISDL